MKFPQRGIVPILAVGALSWAPDASAVRGMVVDRAAAGSVKVIDTTSDTILASIPYTPSSTSNGDCTVMSDGTIGMASNFTANSAHNLFNLQTLTLAPPTILSTFQTLDLSIMPNNRYAIGSGGSNVAPVLSYDLLSRTQVSTLSFGGDVNASSACDDGISVLAASFTTDRINRAVIDPGGVLSLSGDPPLLGVTDPNNVHCAPTSRCGITLQRTSPRIKSFTLPLTGAVVSDVVLGGLGINADFNDAGTVLFTRDNGATLGLKAWNFDPVTCVVGSQIWSATVSTAPTNFGIDQMAYSPTDNKVYVAQGAAGVRVYNGATGVLITTIAGFTNATGICFPRGMAPPTGNQPPNANAGGPYVEECNGNPSTVPLNGSGSNDPDNNPLTYAWTTTCPGGTFSNPTAVSPILSVPNPGCLLNCTVTLTVSDGMLQDSETANVTIQDTTAPVIQNVPPSMTVECDAVPPVPTNVTATDGCDASPSLTFDETPTSGSCPDSYTLTRTWTAVDDCNNTTTVSQTIAVVDTTPPVLHDVPPDATVDCASIPPPANVTATDNCAPPPTVDFMEDEAPGGCPVSLTITRTWSATDPCGNTVSASQILTVLDASPPVVEEGSSNLACLKPSNHKYVCFKRSDFDVTITEGCSNPVSWRFGSCASDQCDDAPCAQYPGQNGDGSTVNDCVVAADGETFCVRAERAGSGPNAAAGRHYAVGVIATDSCGNASGSTVIGYIYVPHDQRPGLGCR